MFTSLPPQGSPTISSANIMDSGIYFLSRLLVHPCVWGTGMNQGRSLVQPHIHVDYVAFASCKSRTLVRQPQFTSCISLTYFFWYVALHRASPDILPRYPIVCLNIASVVLLLGMNQNYTFHEFPCIVQKVS